MEDKARKLREELKTYDEKFKKAKEELQDYERNCEHVYGKVIYDPIHTGGYTTAGDPPGTMGVDWQGPVYVPAETKPRWKRTCEKCGLEEITTQTEDKVEKIPKFGKRGRWG